MIRPWSSTLNEITNDATRAFRDLHAQWEEEDFGKEEMSKRMDTLRLELLKFWENKIHEEKLSVLMYKVQNVRKEIEEWWEKCFMSKEEVEEFEEFKSTNFSSALLDSHFRELARLKRRYERDESLFQLIKKHQDTWKRVVIMDKQLYNPERLFQNRGAQLLQEEKDRRIAQKDLPRLEEIIKRATASFQRENGRPFLIYGKTFSEMIMYQQEQHKENQKNLRSTKKRCCDHIAPAVALSTIQSKAITLPKLKRKLISENTPSPHFKQYKQARLTSCIQKSVSQHPTTTAMMQRKIRLPVRRKLIDRTGNV